MRAMTAAGRTLFGPEFSFEGVVAAGGLDRMLFAEAAAKHGLVDHHAHVAGFHDEYVAQLDADFRARTAEAAPKPGVETLLTDLRQREDVELGIVSGNYRRAGAIKLSAARIDPRWFAVTGYSDDGPDRPSLVRHAMAQAEARRGGTVDPREVIVIGDTPRDVHCAQANGCVAFGVATGPYDVAVLREAGADVAVGDLSDASALWELLDERA